MVAVFTTQSKTDDRKVPSSCFVSVHDNPFSKQHEKYDKNKIGAQASMNCHS
jgi:hypothetical protein